MKKILSILFVFVSVFLLTACGSKDGLDVNKTKSDKYMELSYEVPEAFEKDKQDTINEEGDTLLFADYSYRFDKLGSNGKYDDSCSLTFSYDSSFKDYTLEKYANIYQNGAKGTKKTINGVEWLVFKEELNEKMIDYEYYAKFNNHFYNARYSDWGSGNLCGEAQEVIINSFKLSK